MSDQLMKTFWKAVSVVEEDGGFSVRLDDKPLKTPAKAAFTVPSQGLAQAIADEWSALDDKIDPTRLPFTKLCNAAIDNMSEKARRISALRTAGIHPLLTTFGRPRNGVKMRKPWLCGL